MRKLLFFLLLMFSLVAVTAQGVPAQINANTNVGYDIRFPEYTHARVNTTFDLHVHVYNRSNGLLLDNTSVACFLHLYNPMGTHILQQRMGYDRDVTPLGEFDITILQGNFSMLGTHSYVIQCNSTIFGGFASGIFDVTYSGAYIESSESTLTITFIILFFITIITMVLIGSRIPDEDVKDDLGQVIGINYWKYGKNIVYMVSWLLFVYFLFTVSNVAFYYLPDMLLAKTFFLLYRILFTASMIALPIYCLFLLVQILRDKQLTKIINQGFQP